MPKLPKAKARAVAQAPEAPRFNTVPDGVYRCQLKEVTVRTPKGGGDPFWRTVWDIAEKGFSGRLFENISLGESSEWKMKEFFDAFDEEPDTDTDELIGEYAFLQLGSETQKVGKRKGEIVNTVEKFIAPDEVDRDEEEDDEDDADEGEGEDDEEEEEDDEEGDDEDEAEDEEEDDEPPPPKRSTTSTTARDRSSSERVKKKGSGSSARTPEPDATSRKRASSTERASRTTRSTEDDDEEAPTTATRRSATGRRAGGGTASKRR